MQSNSFSGSFPAALMVQQNIQVRLEGKLRVFGQDCQSDCPHRSEMPASETGPGSFWQQAVRDNASRNIFQLTDVFQVTRLTSAGSHRLCSLLSTPLH